MDMRNRWDEVFGHIATLFKCSGAWEPLGFVDFAHYCEERLGMARRTVMQRVALERTLSRIPLLRQAPRGGPSTHQKARAVAPHLGGGQAPEGRPPIAGAPGPTSREPPGAPPGHAG